MADMDIEMDIDLDVGLGYEEYAGDVGLVHAIDLITEAPKAVPSTPNDTSVPNYSNLVPEKIHIRGLDDLKTDDIHAFAAEHFPSHRPFRIDWIDDTSANIVYASAEVAQEALIAFASLDSTSLSEVLALHDIPAKTFAHHPSSNLQVRLAVVGDKKLPGARDRSRFYLFNPEHDLAEQRRRDTHGRGNRYRDRDDGGYRSQRYDDREQRKREANEGFDASIYDDDEEALAKRSAKNRPRNFSHSPRGYSHSPQNYSRSPRDYSSGSDSRSKDRGPERSRELFPVRDGELGRLRDRSASPMRGNEWESKRDDVRLIERKRDMAIVANREKARLIKQRLKEAGAGKELFPNKINTHHPRSNAFDAVSDTADLFADRMDVPFTDGANDERPLASRVTNQRSTLGTTGFNIRGTAKVPQTFSIKGAAGSVKELFPATLGDNSGKELFSGRVQRRQKAEDLFH